MGKPIQWTPEIVPNGGIDEAVHSTQIAENRWQSASNAEPLPDGVRSRPGFSVSNTTPLWTINLTANEGTDTRTFTDGTSEFISQGFTVGGSGIVLAGIAVRLALDAGSPTGDVRCAIYTNSGGSPDAAVSGAGFGDFGTFDSSTATATALWERFTLSAKQVTLSASTVYHLVIEHIGAAAGNTIKIEEDTTGNPYTGGTVNYASGTLGTPGGWTAVAAADLNFRVYVSSTRAAIIGLKDYQLSDAATQRHLVFADAELYKNVSGTMTPLSDRDRAGFTVQSNTWPSFAVGQDRCFITYGTDAVSRKYYILSGTDYFENEGISAPTGTVTLGATGGSALADGTWYVDWYYYNSDLGISSKRRYDGVDTLSVVTASEHITISDIPTTLPRAGDRADKIRFETKLSGTHSVYALHKEIDLGTTSTTIDSTDDRTTQAVYDDDVPPQHKFKLVAENRQFLGGNTTNPWRLYFSKISTGTAYYESFPSTNFRDFGKGDGDFITALAFVPPRFLVLGFKNSIWAIDARTPKTSDRILIARGVGIAHHLALKVVDGRMFFVSDADERKGLFVWEGAGRPISLSTPDIQRRRFTTQIMTGEPGLDDTFKGLNQARLKYASCANLATGDGRSQWWTLLSSAGQTVHNRIVVYDYALKAWTVYQTAADMAVLGQVDVSSINEIFIGYLDGIEAEADSGTNDHVAVGEHDGSDNASVLSDSAASFGTLIGYTVRNVTDGSSGTITANTTTTVTATLAGGTDDDWDGGDVYKITGPINTVLTLKDFDFGSQRLKKRLRFVDHVVASKLSGAISLLVTPDFGQGSEASTSLQQLAPGTAFTLGTSTLGGAHLLGGPATDISDRTRLRTLGKYLRPKFSSASDFQIKTLAFGVQPTGKL